MNTENVRSSSPKKVLLAVVGTFFYTIGIKMFISGLGLYSGGVMGLSQLIRTLIVRFSGPMSFDLSGVIYYMINIPIFRCIGCLIKSAICFQ